ncbi:unnamed protein product [Acanthoscelides obtectus]|nr:unnamed protein product [Acanthoscelides obtectus]CAK1651158.1 Epidermal retinol dehydrogenase 2 [Acanthoscelides obtectus]
MIEKGQGHIVTVASMAGYVGISKLVDYCASKFAAVGFDEALRVELEQQGIKDVKTTVVSPYFIQQTGMFENVRSRFFPTLNSNQVADRIVEALVREEYVVMLPTIFKYLTVLKAMVPWSAMALFIANFIPDPSPHNQGNPVVQVKNADEKIKPVKNNSNSILSSSVTQLNKRLVLTGKDL